MKTFIYINHEQETAETVCQFADEFSRLPVDVQLDIARTAQERLASLVSSIEAIIARSSAGNP